MSAIQIGNSRWTIWALLLGLPLLFLPDAADPYATIRWAVTAGVALWAWASSVKRWREIVNSTPNIVLAAILVFSLAGLASMAVALHPLEALWDVARWAMILGLMLRLAWTLRQNPQAMRDVWRAGVVATLVLGGIRILQYAQVIEGIPAGGDPRAATLGNPNFFAGAMVMLLALCVGAALRERGLWRWIAITASSLGLGMGILGNSSGALLALAAMGLVMGEGAIVLRWPASWYARARGLRLALPILAVVGGIVVFGWLMARPLPAVEPHGDSAFERILIWKKSVEMIAEAPVLGVGAGHWHYHILRLGTVSSYQGFATRYFMQAHNDYLQLTAERGVLGGLALVALLGMLWFRGWRRVGEGNQDWSALAAMGGLTAWMVFACTNLPGEQAYLALLLVVFGALLLAQGGGDEVAVSQVNAPSSKANQSLSLILAVLFVLGTAITLMIHGLWIGADRANYKLLTAKGNQDWAKTERAAAQAVSWYNPNDRISGTPIVWYEGIALLSRGNAQAALPKLLAAKAQHPWHPQVSSNLGAAYFMVGDKAAAAEELEELIHRFPEFGDARINLTEIYLTMGDAIKASETIAYWATHKGNPQYDNYYAKVSAMLGGGHD